MARTPQSPENPCPNKNEKPSMPSWRPGGKCRPLAPAPSCSMPPRSPSAPLAWPPISAPARRSRPHPRAGDAAGGAGERLPVHLERPRSASAARRPARRTRRRASGQEGIARPGRRRVGGSQLRARILPYPPGQPGIIRRGGGAFRSQRRHRVDNPDGLLRHVGLHVNASASSCRRTSPKSRCPFSYRNRENDSEEVD